MLSYLKAYIAYWIKKLFHKEKSHQKTIGRIQYLAKEEIGEIEKSPEADKRAISCYVSYLTKHLVIFLGSGRMLEVPLDWFPNMTWELINITEGGLFIEAGRSFISIPEALLLINERDKRKVNEALGNRAAMVS